jgi:MFS transporter, DHA2 family, multidrug resistance protein
VGTSLGQTMQERRDQFHTLRLGESLDAFNAAVVSFLEQARGVFVQQTGDPVAAQQQLAWPALESLHQQPASTFAYFDVFLMLTVVTLGLVPVVLLMKRSVARKGAHIAGE